MCGISGFVGSFESGLLEKMTGAQAHRGPDGAGHWQAGNVGLGHRRLSIIDLSNAASQPMESVDGRYVTVFNGEIYNFKELADDLKSHGYTFNAHSDTAILAPLYDLHGSNMLHKLSGIFAFAIWDKKEEKLFAARDHMGIKPFYYCKTEQGLLFASELKSLLFAEGVDRSVDHDSLFSYLTYLWCPGEGTMLKGVKKLLPGHMIHVAGGKTEIRQWYEPPMPELVNGKPQYDKSKKPQDLLHLLDEVVDQQMVSDVPVGTFLSGGVDSSAIAASMAHRDQRPFDAFCITFEGDTMAKEGFSEDVEYARKVAERYDNIQLHEVVMDETCLNKLPEMVYFLDEPQADPAPLYVREISRIARERGVKVLMSGTGGDDVFSGYRRHQAACLLENIDFLPHSMRKGLGGLLSKFGSGAMKRRFMKLRYILESELEESLTRSYHYTENSSLISLLSDDLKKEYMERTADHLENTLSQTEGQHGLNRQLYMEWHGFLPDHNLNYTDKLGMAEGVEIRVPLLDPKMFEFAADLPIGMKMNGAHSKYIFKRSLEERLPKDVLYRAKAGFGAPLRQWITGSSYDMVQDILMSESFKGRGLFDVKAVEGLIQNTVDGTVDGAYTILSLMVIELWMQQFKDVNAPMQLVA